MIGSGRPGRMTKRASDNALKTALGAFSHETGAFGDKKKAARRGSLLLVMSMALLGRRGENRLAGTNDVSGEIEGITGDDGGSCPWIDAAHRGGVSLF